MRRTLLIVEDSELSRELLTQIFEQTYELILAGDGETAVAVASTGSPDLILMDVGLPGMSGLEAVRLIRARPESARIPIIAVSSRVMPGDKELATDAGCDAFVAKPFDDEVLVEMVGRLLESR